MNDSKVKMFNNNRTSAKKRKRYFEIKKSLSGVATQTVA